MPEDGDLRLHGNSACQHVAFHGAAEQAEQLRAVQLVAVLVVALELCARCSSGVAALGGRQREEQLLVDLQSVRIAACCW